MAHFMSPEVFQILMIGLIFLLSAIVGSIPLGAFMRKIYEIDPRRVEATPSAQMKYFLSQVLDGLKGVFVIALAQGNGINLISILSGSHELIQDQHLSLFCVWLAGLFALIGHCYTPWKRFREGKGISVLLGIGFMISPVSTLVGIIGAIVAWIDDRDVAILSMTGLILASVTHLVLYPLGAHVLVGLFYLYFILGQFESYMDTLLGSKVQKT